MAARIDHRSYKEQRIDLIPTIHEGYEVRAMAKRGIKTVIGELNRAIRQFNQMFISLKESVQWMKTAYEEMKAELQTLPSMRMPLTRTQPSWLLFPRSTRLALRVSSRRTPLAARSAVWQSVLTRTLDRAV